MQIKEIFKNKAIEKQSTNDLYSRKWTNKIME